VAEELCDRFGVLEPLQTAMSVEDQIVELKSVIEAEANRPVVLIGHSWGAWLAWLTAARHASLASKLILVGSGGFRPGDGQIANETRMERLTEAQREELDSLHLDLASDSEDVSREAFGRFGRLFGAVDCYDAIPHEEPKVDLRPDIFASVWPEAAELRANGKLLEAGRTIRCPVVAFHGDYDSHPLAGVRTPLERVLDDFRLVALPQCGHEPWHEKHAREPFFRLLREEIAASVWVPGTQY